MKNVTIIAGPCSIDEKNIEEAVEIGRIPEIDGVRCVGLKSVTSPRPFMGIDKDWFFGGRLGIPPSVALARRIIGETGKFVATEVMDIEQLYPYDRREFDGKLFLWNPAIMQLGWPIFRAARLAESNSWGVGLKNPKWLGDIETAIPYSAKNKYDDIPVSNGEKVWWGNAQFTGKAGVRPIMIHRGFETPNKGRLRNVPHHEAAGKMQLLGYEVYFDPSHTFGPNLRDEIVDRTLEVLELPGYGGPEYLYSGILIEVGTSKTDTDQHISFKELRRLIDGIKYLRGI